MKKIPDIEEIQQLLGIRIDDVTGNDVRRFQSSLTGLSNLRPLRMQNTSPSQNTEPENKESSAKEVK